MEDKNITPAPQEEIKKPQPAVNPPGAAPAQQNQAQPEESKGLYYFPLKLAMYLFLLAFPVTFYYLLKRFWPGAQDIPFYVLAGYFVLCAVLLTMFSGKVMKIFVALTAGFIFMGMILGETIFFAVSLVPMFVIVLKVLSDTGALSLRKIKGGK